MSGSLLMFEAVTSVRCVAILGQDSWALAKVCAICADQKAESAPREFFVTPLAKRARRESIFSGSESFSLERQLLTIDVVLQGHRRVSTLTDLVKPQAARHPVFRDVREL